MLRFNTAARGKWSLDHWKTALSTAVRSAVGGVNKVAALYFLTHCPDELLLRSAGDVFEGETRAAVNFVSAMFTAQMRATDADWRIGTALISRYRKLMLVYVEQYYCDLLITLALTFRVADYTPHEWDMLARARPSRDTVEVLYCCCPDITVVAAHLNGVVVYCPDAWPLVEACLHADPKLLTENTYGEWLPRRARVMLEIAPDIIDVVRAAYVSCIARYLTIDHFLRYRRLINMCSFVTAAPDNWHEYAVARRMGELATVEAVTENKAFFDLVRDKAFFDNTALKLIAMRHPYVPSLWCHVGTITDAYSIDDVLSFGEPLVAVCGVHRYFCEKFASALVCADIKYMKYLVWLDPIPDSVHIGAALRDDPKNERHYVLMWQCDREVMLRLSLMGHLRQHCQAVQRAEARSHLNIDDSFMRVLNIAQSRPPIDWNDAHKVVYDSPHAVELMQYVCKDIAVLVMEYVWGCQLTGAI